MELLSKMAGMSITIGKWLVKISSPATKAVPEYKAAFEQLAERISKISPDLAKIAQEVQETYDNLAEEARKVREEKGKSVQVESIPDEITEKKSSLNIIAKENVVRGFLSWVRQTLFPKV